MQLSDIISGIWAAIKPLSPIQVVNENNQGVLWTLGQVTKIKKNGGVIWILPLIQRLDVIDVTTGAFTFLPQSVTLKDGNSVVVQLGITYHVESAATMLLTVGDNDVEEVIAVIGRGVTADVLLRHTQGELADKKADIEEDICDLMCKEARKYGLECDSAHVAECTKCIGIKVFN